MKENKKMKDNFISLKDISSELIRRSEEKAELKSKLEKLEKELHGLLNVPAEICGFNCARAEKAINETDGAKPIAWLVGDNNMIGGISERLYIDRGRKPAYGITHRPLYDHPPVKVPEGWRIERLSGYDFEVEHPDGSTITIKDGQPGIMAHMFNELCVALTAQKPS